MHACWKKQKRRFLCTPPPVCWRLAFFAQKQKEGRLWRHSCEFTHFWSCVSWLFGVQSSFRHCFWRNRWVCQNGCTKKFICAFPVFKPWVQSGLASSILNILEVPTPFVAGSGSVVANRLLSQLFQQDAPSVSWSASSLGMSGWCSCSHSGARPVSFALYISLRACPRGCNMWTGLFTRTLRGKHHPILRYQNVKNIDAEE